MKGCASMVVMGGLFWIVVLMAHSLLNVAICFVLLVLLILLFTTPNDPGPPHGHA